MISNSNATSLAVSTYYSEQCAIQAPNCNVNVLQSSTDPPSRSSPGPVAIFWDIENCHVPSDVRPEDVAGNIRLALRVHPIIKGAVTLFSAYGDFNAFPRRVREGCQRTGVKLIDIPNGRKDAADKAILVDMFLFALDNPPPASIMLISGDVDFAPALHILGQRGYTVILVFPSRTGVSSALCNAGRFVWDWPSVAHGEGYVPPTKPCPRGAPVDYAGFLRDCHLSENAFGNEEEDIVYRGLSQSYHNCRDFAIVSQSLTEYNSCVSTALPSFTNTLRSQSLPSALNEATSVSAPAPAHAVDQNDGNWVQPGDVDGLKGQLVRLLELSGGCLLLVCVPAKYLEVFGRPLCIAEYGAFKLVKLLKKMSDAISVAGKGQKKFVYLRNARGGPSVPSPHPKKDKKGKGVVCTSDKFSDDKRVVIETINQNLLQFKHELEKILASYSSRILLSCFEAMYQHRYKKPLDYHKFGVNKLEELLERVGDVVIVQEEPVTKKKFLAVVLGSRGCFYLWIVQSHR